VLGVDKGVVAKIKSIFQSQQFSRQQTDEQVLHRDKNLPVIMQLNNTT